MSILGSHSSTSALRSLTRGLLDAAVPQACAACGVWLPAGGGTVCDTCDAEVLRGMDRPYCPRCGRTLPSPSIHEDHCARCKGEKTWNVAGVARVGLYTPAIRALAVRLKYNGRERNSDYLALRLGEAICRAGWLGELDALVPVPLHRLRWWQRSCDHARVLADALALRIGLPVQRAVWRCKYTPSQTELTVRTKRFENVKGCFAPQKGRRGDVAGRTVCIVDNVLSTGATVYEVSKALRRAHAKRIYVAVIARPAATGDPPANIPDTAEPLRLQ